MKNRKIKLNGFHLFLLALLLIPPSFAIGIYLGTPKEIRDNKMRQERIIQAYEKEIKRLREKYPETAVEYDCEFRPAKPMED